MEYFNFKRANLEPGKGDLLISEPFLPDPNFSRTVVLMCEHNEEGSFGFVLNKSANLYLSDILPEAVNLEKEVFIGGPVQQDTLHFVHRADNLIEGGVEIGKGLYWGGNYEQLLLLIQNEQLDADAFKFFIGYSGWAANQLQNELKENSWIVSRNVEISQVFDTQPEELWKSALDRIGGRYKVYSNYPVDPRLN